MKTITLKWIFKDAEEADKLFAKLEDVSQDRDAWLKVIEEMDMECWNSDAKCEE